MKRPEAALIVALVLAPALIASCSDAANDTIATRQASPISVVSPVAKINATVNIQEKGGKQVIDAWFTRSQNDSAAVEPLWSDAGDACYALAVPLVSAHSEAGKVVYEQAATAITIEGRTGNYVRLLPQRAAGTVVYASDARWLDVDLPPDAVLSMVSSEPFTALQGVALTPLPRLERDNPASARLLRGETSIRWQASTASADQLRLTLRAVQLAEDVRVEPRLQVVWCTLTDDGAFDVPSLIRNAFGDAQFINVDMQRYRQTRIENATTTLTIIQSSSG